MRQIIDNFDLLDLSHELRSVNQSSLRLLAVAIQKNSVSLALRIESNLVLNYECVADRASTASEILITIVYASSFFEWYPQRFLICRIFKIYLSF